MTNQTRTIDVRGLSLTTEQEIYIDGGLFPVADANADGAIAAIMRGGAGHIGLPGRLDVLRSRDGGETWSPPAVVVNTDIDDRNPAFGFTPAGTLILVYYRQASYDADGKYTPERGKVTVAITRSFDQGLTWSEPVGFTDFDGVIGSPYGRLITLADGSIGFNMYRGPSAPGEANGSYLVVSRDDGVTWERPRLIAAGRNETALLTLPNGDLLAAARKNERDEQSLALTRSSDNGLTWSTPVEITGVMQHPADLVLLGGERVLLTYGNRQPPFRVEGKISEDGGQTWRPEILHFSGQLYGYDLPAIRRTDLGYPSNVILNGERGVTLYYYNPSHPNNARDWTNARETPFYQSTSYRAIAVTWSVTELLAALND